MSPPANAAGAAKGTPHSIIAHLCLGPRLPNITARAETSAFCTRSPCEKVLTGHILRGFLPRLFATCRPQQKIFQDKFTVAGSRGRTANAAGGLLTGDRFRSGIDSDHLIKCFAVRALEKRISHGSNHVCPQPTPSIHFKQSGATVNSSAEVLAAWRCLAAIRAARPYRA